MKHFFIFLFSSLLASCSSMHLKLKSAYEDSQGKGVITFEKSYDLASFPWICGTTFIFYGGGCWAYLMFPMVPQEQRIIEDAKKSLMQELGTDTVSLIEPEIVRESWQKSKTKLEFVQ